MNVQNGKLNKIAVILCSSYVLKLQIEGVEIFQFDNSGGLALREEHSVCSRRITHSTNSQTSFVTGIIRVCDAGVSCTPRSNSQTHANSPVRFGRKEAVTKQN
jgi:hypothetical protein